VTEVPFAKRLIFIGVMDGQAYTDKMSWQVLIDEMGFNTIQLRDNRYDAVIHLVTAANGAEDHYSFDNVARYEVISNLNLLKLRLPKWQLKSIKNCKKPGVDIQIGFKSTILVTSKLK
jgi:hypothetical protein